MATISKIEDEIIETFDDETKETALKFVSYLNENQLTPKLLQSKCWKIPYKEHYLCMIQFEPNEWRFTFFFGDYSGEFDEDFIISVQEHVQFCKSCHDPCTSGIDTTIFGKEYKNVCSQLTIQFENPNDRTLEYIKRMIKYGEGIVQNSESWHAHN